MSGIRGVHEGKLWLYVYGRVITGHVDPIEKKPVSHWRPGSKIFSIATTGCNWLCHPAGSRILSYDGDTRNVEEVRPGDALWSVAEETRLPAPGIVTAVGQRTAAVLRIVFRGRKHPLLATREHPILSQNGWIPSGRLHARDRVLAVGDMGVSRQTAIGSASDLDHASQYHPAELATARRMAERNSATVPGFEWVEVQKVELETAAERVYSFECIP